jgi:hypothetical protein
MPRDVIVVAVFASLVVRAVFVGVASGEIETHVLILLAGKEERFGRTWGWIYHFNLASERGPIVA